MKAPFIGSVPSGRPLVGGRDIVGRFDDRSILIRNGAAKRLQRDLGSGQRLELARKPHLQPGTLSVAASRPDVALLRLLQFSLAMDLQQRASRAQGGLTVSLVLMTGMLFRAKGMGSCLVKEQRTSVLAFPFQCEAIGWLFRFK